MNDRPQQPNPEATRRKEGPVSLPVLAVKSTNVRPSRMSKWRAISLVAVHLVMIAHGVQWLISGKTLSPIEPSEAMYTLNDGFVNAGFVFFAVSILATLVLGRYFCGWGCHVVAYQDLCAWLLKKVGIKPKPFRSRFLVLAPFALAVYMFVWPTAYRLYAGRPAPPTTNHLLTAEFWKTFPGFWTALLTVIVCGFVIVYFLGAKGFCTYACPYGGFFGLADKFAPGRIRVSDACRHCGHCTAVCSSNVRVHEEVAVYGMVVDPGCLKCMDCVSVCPNNALSFGFGGPAITQSQTRTTKPRRFDFTMTQELLMVLIGLGALLAFRGLYDRIPLLLAMGMAAITAFALMKSWKVLVASNVRFQNLQLKRGKHVTKAGAIYALFSLALITIVIHSGIVQFVRWTAHRDLVALHLPDSIWSPDDRWWQNTSQQTRKKIAQTIESLRRVNRIGITNTPSAMEDLVWLYMATDDVARAENTARKLIRHFPFKPDYYRGLAGVLRKMKRFDDAEQAYRKALEIQPSFDRARIELARMLQRRNRPEDALRVLREGSAIDGGTRWPLHVSELLSALSRFDQARAELAPFLEKNSDDPDVLAAMGFIETRAGHASAGIEYWRRALALDPDRTNVRYSLAAALLRGKRIPEAIENLRILVKTRSDFIPARYDLAVALSMNGQLHQALQQAEQCVKLAPDNARFEHFAAALRRQVESGDPAAP